MDVTTTATEAQQPSNQTDDREHPLVWIFAILLLCLGAYLWYGWFVENERTAQFVLQCMGGDTSRTAYEACVAQL